MTDERIRLSISGIIADTAKKLRTRLKLHMALNTYGYSVLLTDTLLYFSHVILKPLNHEALVGNQ